MGLPGFEMGSHHPLPGTWFDSTNGYIRDSLWSNGHLQTPSNVTRISRAIKTVSETDNIPQIVYYQAGVGTDPTMYGKLVGGGTGLGLSEHCREAYAFLADNYNAGDHVILIGFSRGAFTARSVAGMIGSVGLLTKAGLDYFYEVFKDYKNRGNSRYRPDESQTPFKNRTNFQEYASQLEKLELTRLDIPIKAIAVWDTVGALGLPRTAWLERVGIMPQNREYAFHDTDLNDTVEYAFQALALDEARTPFSPTLWEKRMDTRTHLKQCWFPGVHENVGGGYEDMGLSNLTLAWMMQQLSPFIEFDLTYLHKQNQLVQDRYKTAKKPPRPWAGDHYFRTDRASNRPTKDLLLDTEEYVHASVRARYGFVNLGVGDRGPYNPAALKQWRLVPDGGVGGGGGASHGQGRYHWQYIGKDARFPTANNVLPEDVLGPIELELLRLDPQSEAALLAVEPDLAKRSIFLPLRITNRCKEIIYPAIGTQAGIGPKTNGFGLRPNTSRPLSVSADWQGRVWGRTNCSFNAAGTGASNRGGRDGSGRACGTGDCNGIVNCLVTGDTPVTLVEFTLSSPSNQAFYDISLVDGYNLPVAIVLLADESDSAAVRRIPPNLTNPVCVGTASLLAASSGGYDPYANTSAPFLGTNASCRLPFETAQTVQRVARWCPFDLQVQPYSRPADGVYPYPDDTIQRPFFDPCFSACARYNKPSDCCTEFYNSPATCKPSAYSRNAKAVCPDAYSFAYDDQTSTFIVPSGAGFEVVFCPAGRSTNILKTLGSPSSPSNNRQQQLSPDVLVDDDAAAAAAAAIPATPQRSNATARARRRHPPANSLWALVVAVGTTIGSLEWFPL
ncbi:MAG: hypothetical protein M1826_005876 [Phylliscum demangeonii]|nr:MAG: hypothetical protein M1826_005876 [Phylliscum demangeonii]